MIIGKSIFIKYSNAENCHIVNNVVRPNRPGNPGIRVWATKLQLNKPCRMTTDIAK